MHDKDVIKSVAFVWPDFTYQVCDIQVVEYKNKIVAHTPLHIFGCNEDFLLYVRLVIGWRKIQNAFNL